MMASASGPMSMAGTQPGSVAPLFDWPERRQVALLEAERADLKARIAQLRPRSHARIVLEARLVEVTRQSMAETARLNAPLRTLQ